VRWAAAVLLVLATLVGCTSDEPHAPAAPVAPSAASATMFSVGWVPDGYELVAQGRGVAASSWGSDEVGTNEPFTTLAPEGSHDPDDLVVVAATGYAGYQGGFAQASITYCCKGVGPQQRFRFDGHRAIYSPPHEERRWSELVVARGDDLAIRLIATGWSRERLVDLARRTTPSTDHEAAPAVDPPKGWRVLGSVGVLGLAAATSPVQVADRQMADPDGSGRFWSPDESYAGLWQRDGDALLVTESDGSAIDGLPGIRYWKRYGYSAEPLRDGFLLRHRTGSNAVIRRLDSGALLLVASTSGRDPDELWRVASSVDAASAQSWERQRREAWGSPPRLDAETEELARGHRPGYDWLLPAISGGVAEYHVPDRCLKLSTFRYACTEHDDTGQAKVQFATAPEPFLIVSTQVHSRSLRITQDGRVRTLPLVTLPGRYENQAVLAFDVVHGPYVCDGPAPAPSLRLELVGDDGTTTCITH
jgi:hypothetical protein